MAYLNPQDAYEDFRDRVFEGIQSHFPIKGKMQTLELEKLEVNDKLHPDDLRAQHDAKSTGSTYAVPVYGHLVLKNTQTGEVVSRKKMRLADIPKQTQRYSYILDGQEFQVDNQWQLKPGAYVRRRKTGDLETRFNVKGGNPFDVVFDEKSKQFYMDIRKSKVPMYPVMKALGVDDHQLESSWGKDVLEANKKAHGAAGALDRLHKSITGRRPESQEQSKALLEDLMHKSELRPDATEYTLGKPIDRVTGEALHLATSKMLKVQSGTAQPDDRDSIIFKDLRSAADFARDKLEAARRGVQIKAGRKLNTTANIRDIVSFDMFNEPVRQSFTKNSAVRAATQINPIEMVSSAMQTTLMGTGGIKSDRSVTNEAKFVDPSHFGFLDPINTPEGTKTGVSLRMPMGVKKIGNTPHVPLYNLQTGKTEYVPPAKFMASTVVLPDQVEWKDGKPVPRAKVVKVAGKDNELEDAQFHQAQYVMKHPSQVFNMTSNLVPFLNNTSGNRAGMATRHMEQSISLVHREAPLVQVATGVNAPHADTFEKVLGFNASHQAPASGVVKSVQPGSITIQSPDGKVHEVQTYDNYPLNEAKSVMHSEPIVKPGMEVKKGQVIADTNFSKNGALALGSNLRVAYLPYKGYNFEDGVVISESAAKKLSSVHMYKPFTMTKGLQLSKQGFLTKHTGLFKKDQVEHIGDDGVARIGSRVKPGDPLLLATKPFELKDRQGIHAIRKSITGVHSDASMVWDGEVEGEVVGISRKGGGIQVHVKTVEPMQVGDKMAGRYGNKGIVTMVVPDHEMPHTKDGKHIEVALNPTGVPGRMNVGQILETAASKIAEKTGRPYLVNNFDPSKDMVAHVQNELKQHGLTDKEELVDPVTGQSLGKVMTGKQHIIKLVHQVDKKVHVTPGMSLIGAPPSKDSYDLNLQPHHGQRIGSLGMYAMLAHGAKANLREMQTWKSEGEDKETDPAKRWPSQHLQVWTALQTGQPLPTPKPTFSFKKFEDLLRATGVNLEKQGHELILTPMTDKDVVKLTGDRVVKKPGERLEAKIDKKTGEMKVRKDGLFDEKTTGGHGGRKWARIPLAEPMPNPLFEAPIRALTGLKQQDFDDLVAGRKGLNAKGDLQAFQPGMTTGGYAIESLLHKVDTKKDLDDALKRLQTAPKAEVDRTLKKVKYLQALQALDMKPADAYVMKNLPVLPPALRPASPMADGNIKYADLNHLYMHVGLNNEKLGDPEHRKTIPHEEVAKLREATYEGVKAVMGFGVPYKDQEHKGLLHQIAGPSPKKGYFQNVLMNKRQDLTMRSTIVPEPSLGLDEVGLPTQHALDLFRPFVVKKLQDMGVAKDPIDAHKELAKQSPAAVKALDKVMIERPVMIKRDPVLHKYGIQGFQPKRVEGNAIKIHPLVVGGFNADFDGDSMSVFVPISREAVQEVHKMKPTENLFAESSGKVVYQPSLESAMGLYKLSMTGDKTTSKFKTPGEALDAVRTGKIKHSDVVTVAGKQTTPGRILLSTALPSPLQNDVLHNLEVRLDGKGGIDDLLRRVAKEHTGEFGTVVNKLKDLGNHASFGVVPVPLPNNQVNNIVDPKRNVYVPIGAHTLGLDDFKTDNAAKKKILDPAKAEEQRIRSSSMSKAEQDRKIIDLYTKADKQLKAMHTAGADEHKDNLFLMHKAGIKPGWDQYKQMRLAPLLMADSQNRIIPLPVTKSYSEGVDMAGYWTQMHGARRGTVMRVQETQEPGTLSKMLMQTMMDTLITSPDCGTNRGILMTVHEKDVNDRVLARDFKAGSLHLKAGTTLTPDLLSQVKAADKDAKLVVRSPLKCEHGKGICQKCAGLAASGNFHDVGTNIGAISAQTLGERAVQLPMKQFHTGGVATSIGGLANSFTRLEQLLTLPKKIPNAATLAQTSGTITKVDNTPVGVDIYVNGVRHHVGRDSLGRPLNEALPDATYQTPWKPPAVGMKVQAGYRLSDPLRTQVNIHDYYGATKSIDRVQNQLVSEVYDLYKDEGIKRRHVETVVKAMSSMTKVLHPGDNSHGILRGEFQPLSEVQRINAELVRANKKPIEHSPAVRGINMLPFIQQEDWMAKLQHQRLPATIAHAAAIGGKSSIHGPHPVPALAYGAEFGMTEEKSKLPGHGHLSNVPSYHY